MPDNLFFVKKIMFIVATLIVLVLASQWFNVNWGRLELGQPATITVTGKADGLHANQIATFYAGVTIEDVDREAAVQKVNTQVAELIRQVKEFGIPDEDIKTETLSVYEYDKPVDSPLMYSEGAASIMPIEPGRGEKIWQASNTLVITLREVDRASELATIVTNAGATTVSGPNFTTDNTSQFDQELLQEAMADAREKASAMLDGTGQRVIRVINVYENESYPYLYRESAVGFVGTDQAAVPIEPGSQTLYKSVTVIFEISR